MNDFSLWHLAHIQPKEKCLAAQCAGFQHSQKQAETKNLFHFLSRALQAFKPLLILTPKTLKWSSDL
jgi:hypothetical protein